MTFREYVDGCVRALQGLAGMFLFSVRASFPLMLMFIVGVALSSALGDWVWFVTVPVFGVIMLVNIVHMEETFNQELDLEHPTLPPRSKKYQKLWQGKPLMRYDIEVVNGEFRTVTVKNDQ